LKVNYLMLEVNAKPVLTLLHETLWINPLQ